MTSATPAIQGLARRLIAVEKGRESSGGLLVEAALVCERLRVPLTKLAGVAGFRSLMARALALAAVQMPSLRSLKLRTDGSLDGLEEVVHQPDAGADLEPGVAVVAHLLGLLVTFIGEPLTMRLIQDAWPDASAGDSGTGAGGQP